MSAATFASAPGRIVSTFVPRKRRGAELFLLVLALIVGVGSYALVGLGRDGQVPTDIIQDGGGAVGGSPRTPSWSAAGSWGRPAWSATSPSATSRRTPTRSCSRPSSRSTASG